jgi:tricarballylate dehydrogenase
MPEPTFPASPDATRSDVIVVGAGNAGYSAAHAARLAGARVLVLEKEQQDSAGGNSYYTAGATRIAHSGLDGSHGLRALIEPDPRIDRSEVPPYSREEYRADLEKVTQGRTDPALAQVLVDESYATLAWLQELGLRYRLMYERQAYERPDGSFLFWGGLHVGNVGGGEGLIADHARVAERLGEDVRFGVRVIDLIEEDGRIAGVVADEDGERREYRASAVVLAAGGFEADPEWRETYLGPGWAHAKVRGTPANTGDVLRAALAHGAARGGDWSTAHSVQWDAFTPVGESNRELTNRLTRQSYPLGIIVDRDGRRFLDEGADFRNYTYAKYGAEILKRPGSVAWQLFDATLRPMLRTEEYEMPGISVVQADSLAELAEAAGIDPTGLEQTVAAFNASIDRSKPLDPNVKDGRRANVEPPKSNWASPIETGPFYAYAVTCGVTFTFGGLHGDTYGQVLREDGTPIDGLYACG